MTDANPFTQLVLHAQADQNLAHRQQAMNQIATIAPAAGGLVPENTALDTAATAALNSLYPGWTSLQAP